MAAGTQREALQSFLREQWSDPGLAVFDLEEVVAGWSRMTYRAAVQLSAQANRLALIVQVEKTTGAIADSSVAHDHAVLSALSGTPLPVPRVYGYGQDTAIFGGPFMIVESLPGHSFDLSNRHERAALLALKEGTSLPQAIVNLLTAVHAVPPHRLRLIPGAASAEETAAYELDRCRDLARASGLLADPCVALGLCWLERHRPASGWLTLIHGDFHMRNLLISGDRISGLLDWEVCRRSNPLFDLAYMCNPYLSGKLFTPGSPLVCGVMSPEWLLDEYGRQTGRRPGEEEFHFWRVLAALTLLLVVGNGVTAYAQGRTTSIRQAWARFSEPPLKEDLLALL